MANEIMIGDLNVERADPKVAVVQPDRSRANLIGDIAPMVGETIQGVQQYRTQQAIQSTADAYQTAGELQSRGAAFHPVTGEVLNQEELAIDADSDLAAKITAVEQTSAEAFNRIKAAMEQGRMRGGNALEGGLSQAYIQIENQIRKISALTPGFEDVVRQTANEVLGFDPTGFGIRNLLQVPKQADDIKENPLLVERRNKAELYVAQSMQLGTPMTTEQAYTMVDTESTKARLRDSLNVDIELGAVSGDVAVTRFLNTQANPLTGLLGRVSINLGPEGRLEDLDDTMRSNLLKASAAEAREAEFAAALQIAEKAAASTGGFLSATDRTRIREQVNARWADYNSFVDLFSRSSIAAQIGTELGNLANLDAYVTAPLFKMLGEGHSPEMAVLLAKALNNAGNPQQAQLLQRQAPALWQAMGNGNNNLSVFYSTKAVQQLLRGERVNVFDDPEANAQLEKQTLLNLWNSSTGNPEQRRELILQLGNQQPEHSLSMMSADPAAFNRDLTPDNVAPYRVSFGNEVNSMIQEVGDVIADQMSGGNETSVRFEIGNTGRITNLYTSDSPMRRRGPAGRASTANPLEESINKRLLPIVNEPGLVSKLTDGAITSPQQFADIFIRNARAYALDRLIAEEEANIESPTARTVGMRGRRSAEQAVREEATTRLEQYQAERESLAQGNESYINPKP